MKDNKIDKENKENIPDNKPLSVINLGTQAGPLFFSSYNSFLFIFPFISIQTLTFIYPFLINTYLLIYKKILCYYDST